MGLAESLSGPSWFALLVEAGRAWVGDMDTPVEGPVLVWRPWSNRSRARFAAGATGGYVILGPGALASALGHTPESHEMRDAADRAVISPLSDTTDRRDALAFAFGGLSRELIADAPAARAMIDAFLRVIVVEVFRAVHSSAAQDDWMPRTDRSFSRFAELVEEHFRDRWTVNDYAAALGMSRDWLGDTCKRAHGSGPKELIDRRVAVEARLQLENSSNSIQQISGLLGFATTPQFSRFFLRTTGVAPGQYRKAFFSARSNQTAPIDAYEWP